jgi:D-alanyl-D-alanine carboxypeptidase (penicillin-binding protein 5/6)
MRALSWRQLGALLFLPLLLIGCSGSIALAPFSNAPTATPRPTATATPALRPTATPTPAPPPPVFPPPHLYAKAAILIDQTNGQTMYELNSRAELPMASTTKLMTAIVALQHASPDTVITVGPAAVAMENGVDSVMGLYLGDKLTLRDLLYGMLLPSGDDAATAIAVGLAGSPTRFVVWMNTEARALKLHATHFVTVTGLDAPGHYTSARDLARIAEYAMDYDLIAQIVGTSSYAIPATNAHHGYMLYNTNELLRAYPGAYGIKTGSTPAAGECLVFAVHAGNHDYLGVILGAPSDWYRYYDARALLAWAAQVNSYHVPS